MNLKTTALGGKVLLLIALMLVIFSKSYSQSPDKKATLVYINEILGSSTKVEIKGSQLVISYYNDQGQLLREDKAPLAYLDLKVQLETESSLLYIPCLKSEEGCVTRTLTVQKIKKSYDRMSISVNDSGSYLKLKKALQHLIRLTSEIGYKDAITLE